MSDATRSHLYGAGVFTTIRIIDGQPWLWDKHWLRLVHDAGAISLDVHEITERLVRQELDYALEKVEIRNGRARVTLSDARFAAIWPDVDEPESSTTIGIITGESREIVRPFRLTISSHRVNSTSPLAGLKTCNYLEQLLALDEARSRDFSDAVRINERGHLTSTCMANLFWLEDGRLFTPELTTGCLPGTTREFVTETLQVEEVEASLSGLGHPDAIFLTSAGLGVVQVDEFDGRAMPTTDHAILSLIPS